MSRDAMAPAVLVRKFSWVLCATRSSLVGLAAAEKAYDISKFDGRVKRYCIDDHNVPPLEYD